MYYKLQHNVASLNFKKIAKKNTDNIKHEQNVSFKSLRAQ